MQSLVSRHIEQFKKMKIKKNSQKTKIYSLQTFNTTEAYPWLTAILGENSVVMMKDHDHNKQRLNNQQKVCHKHQLKIQPISNKSDVEINQSQTT